MTAKNKTFWEFTHAQQRQIPLEWDQLTGNASGEHRQIQLGGKYKSIRNENGWQELECTRWDTGWERMVKTTTKEPTKLPILNKKHQVEFFGGGFHRHFKDKFHFISKTFLRKKILYQTLQFNLSQIIWPLSKLGFYQSASLSRDFSWERFSVGTVKWIIVVRHWTG